MNLKFLNNLQALRAYAAASVVLVHLCQVFGLVSPFGLYGVDVFFVLSGFIMAMIAAQDSNRFLTRRLIRIVPLYWTFTVGVFLVGLAKPELLHSTRPNLTNLVKSLLFVPYQKESGAVQPLLFLGWTLNYEMFFYLAFALALWWRPRRPAPWVVGIVSFLPLVRLLWTPSSVVLGFYSEPIVLEFIIGMGIYYLFTRYPRLEGGPWLLLALLILSLCILPVAEIRDGLAYRHLALGLPAAVLVFSAVALEKQGYAVTNRLLLLIGDASYVLYLSHPYVLQLGEKVLHPNRWRNPGLRISLGLLLCAAVLAVAVVIHRFLEAPLLTALRRLIFGGRSRSAVKAIPVVPLAQG